MVDAEGGELGLVGISVAFGLVVMTMVFAFADVSGAHINPAVTLALAARRTFPWAAVPGYWGAQVTGAIAAAIVLRASLGDVADLGATTPSGTDAQSFAWEVAMTATLLVVIVAVATRPHLTIGPAALAIGGTIALDALFGGPITGASMNPARSLGPAVASGVWTDLWVYLVGPVAGAALGGLLYQLVRGEHSTRVAEPAPVAEPEHELA